MNISLSQLVLAVSVALCFQTSFSQVGIGATTPNADAILDVTSTTAGLLLPRLALTATTSPAPLTADVAGMTVYNTATAGDVTPGFYYNDGTDWVRLGGGIPVENGLHYDGGSGTNKLGGALVENTTITHGTRQMVFNLNGSGDFNIQDNGVNHFQVRDTGSSFFGGDVYFRDNNSDSGTVLARVLDQGTGGDDGVFDIMRNGEIQHHLHGDGEIVFNEQSTPFDFRIESDTDVNGFKLEGANGQIQFGNYGGGAITGTPTQYLAVDAAGNIIERPATALNGDFWSLIGNTGTNSAINFLGTTDAQDVVFKADNIEHFRIGQTESVLNENSVNYDFRIESNSFDDLFFADASTNQVSIGNRTPVFPIDTFQSYAYFIGDHAVNGYAQSGVGVYGSDATDGFGVEGVSDTVGAGVVGNATGAAAGFIPGSGGSFTGPAMGIFSSGTTPGSFGVLARAGTAATSSFGGDEGVVGNGNFSGVTGINPAGAGRFGVLGSADAITGGVAVFANGDFSATGTKAFTIDHPLDPENKKLKHFSIESNEVLNLYRGIVILDSNGNAKIELPEYFSAINRTFSYQLTPVGLVCQKYT